MADLPNDFWGGWITGLTLISLAALAWVVISIFFYSNRSKDEAHASIVWDENLKEGSTAPPLWWFWLIFVTMIFSILYLILYPGLGSFKGTLNWSQDSRLEKSQSYYESNFSQKRQDITTRSLEDLRSDASLMASAEGIFSRNCATCHGYGGTGQSKLFPDLKDSDWQWGGTEEQIKHSIVEGRNAQMPGFKQLLDEKEIENIAEYVLSLNAGSLDHPGKAKYEQTWRLVTAKMEKAIRFWVPLT